MIEINNWSSLQSYKDRRPPWIRLHKTLLDNFEFHSMSFEAKAILPMLWLLASEDADPKSGLVGVSYQKIAFRLRIKVSMLENIIKECIAHGFLQLNQSCSESVTEALRNRNETVPSETETEAEKKQNNTCALEAFKSMCTFEDFWKEYPKKKSKAQAVKAWERIKPNKILFEKILSTLTKLKNSTDWQKDNGQFIPYPASWLNAEGWNDEIEVDIQQPEKDGDIKRFLARQKESMREIQ